MSTSYHLRNTGLAEFFRLALSHESLVNYMNTNFGLMQHHNYSLAELEGQLPWEREIYIALLMQWLEEEELRRKQEKNRM